MYIALILASIFIAFLTAMLLLHSYLQVGKKYQGIRGFVVGILFNALGTIFAVLTNAHSIHIMIPLSTGFVMVGLLVIIQGLSRFYHQDKRYIDVMVMIGFATALIIYFNSFNYQLFMQIGIFATTITYISCQGAYIFIKEYRRKYDRLNLLSAAIITMIGIINLGRTVNLFFISNTLDMYYLSNDIDVIFVFMHYVLYLVFTTHFNALINQKAWEKIESEELKFKTIFSKSPHPMIMISYKDDRIIDVNESFTHTLGYTKLEVVDKHYSAIKMFDLVKDREQTRQYETSKYEVINREVPVLKKNGDLMHTLLSISIINEFDNKVLLVSMTDITELYQLKEKLDHYAYYDYLTELPNRRLFIRNFNHRVHKREGFSIVSIDLDNFKQVNDVYGHDTGDELLIKIGQRLQGIMKDKGFVARYGGDEFVMILDYHEDQTFLKNEIHHIIQALKEPFILNDKTFYITSSIGSAIYPLHGTTLRELINKADIAMYQVKHHMKDDVKIFEE